MSRLVCPTLNSMRLVKAIIVVNVAVTGLYVSRVKAKRVYQATMANPSLVLDIIASNRLQYELVESKTRRYHGRVGAGRGRAAHGGAAGPGRAGQDADGSFRPGDNRPSCSPRASKSTV